MQVVRIIVMLMLIVQTMLEHTPARARMGLQGMVELVLVSRRSSHAWRSSAHCVYWGDSLYVQSVNIYRSPVFQKIIFLNDLSTDICNPQNNTQNGARPRASHHVRSYWKFFGSYSPWNEWSREFEFPAPSWQGVCRNFDLKTNIMVLWTENLFSDTIR